MKVFARVDSYVHTVRAGSEVTLHQMLLALVERGHEVQVVAQEDGSPRWETLEDRVPVLTNPTHEELESCYEWADVVVTQQGITRKCIEECSGRLPIVFVCHVRGQEHLFLRTGEVALVVFNSQWLALESRHLGPTMVVRPPVRVKDYETPEGSRDGGVLQVNLSEGKGGPLFWWLARHLTHRRFLAAEGTWGEQQLPYAVPPNVIRLAKTRDVREHYARASVVLMPSRRETYGRVALEAACSGIPAIVSPTPGLREALGSAAIYCDPDKPQEWVTALRRLEDPDAYMAASELARSRAGTAEAQTLVELDAWECALLQVASTSRARVWAFASESHYVDHAWPYLASIDPRARGPLVVPPIVNGSQEGTLRRAWDKGALTFRLPSVLNRSQHNDVVTSLQSPDTSGSVVVVVSERDKMAAEAWFPGCIVRGEHGAGQSYQDIDHHSFAGGPGHASCLAATAPGPEVAKVIQAAYPHLPVAVVGCPRLRSLKPALHAPEEKLLVFHFRRDGVADDCQEMASAWDHYADLQPPEGWRVALHLHPRDLNSRAAGRFRAEGWELIPEFLEVLYRASVFAVDNSSVAVEWHAIHGGRLVLLNSPYYRRWINHGLRFWDMLNWPGVQPCDSPRELSATVNAALEAGRVSEASPWYAEFDPSRLSRWLTGMTRPDEEMIQVYAHQTFEGPYGRITRGTSKWVPKLYADAVESKRLARILETRAWPSIGADRGPGPEPGYYARHAWEESGLWRT